MLEHASLFFTDIIHLPEISENPGGSNRFAFAFLLQFGAALQAQEGTKGSHVHLISKDIGSTNEPLLSSEYYEFTNNLKRKSTKCGYQVIEDLRASWLQPETGQSTPGLDCFHSVHWQ